MQDNHSYCIIKQIYADLQIDRMRGRIWKKIDCMDMTVLILKGNR